MEAFVNLRALDREIGYLDSLFFLQESRLFHKIEWEYTVKKTNGITVFQSFLSKRETSNNSESILCFRGGMFGLKQSRWVNLSLIAFRMTRFICLNLLRTNQKTPYYGTWFLVILLKLVFDGIFLVYLLHFPCRDLTSNSECCTQ